MMQPKEKDIIGEVAQQNHFLIIGENIDFF